MDSLLDAVTRYTEAHGLLEGVGVTPVAGLTTVRAVAPSGLAHSIPRPLVCLILQGTKHVTLGHQTFIFNAGDSLLITGDVPTTSQITAATLVKPYLALTLELDLALIAELTEQIADSGPEEESPIRVISTEREVADAALRLVQLLDRPDALAVLQAQLVREMHYWLLQGKHSPAIRRLGLNHAPARRIARAVAVLRREYTQKLRMEKLADVAGMSPSSFYQHFRRATSLSPLQFQKQLRLIEARRLMHGQAATASRAAFAVGYESVPQFTRDYARFFGTPPARDVRAARQDQAVSA
ncbi:AraC family transcriptional regulator [Bordetella sp. 15P40C-2]|uniref:AraC family transcriptional regulator n=1 Tax=Bordetella sp. 15P40C-2 TaxID=2572246 RepID=UPI00132BAD01|nr:AraC family transcriptional regulator [Bordetella sp. 15P40C-2]MVW71098.1 helix-turn-helix domain-containing protein [Bordetella sp. 15P40C-2]